MALPCAHDIQLYLYQQASFLHLVQVHHWYFEPQMTILLVTPPLLAQDPAQTRTQGRPTTSQRSRQPISSTRRDSSHFELPIQSVQPQLSLGKDSPSVPSDTIVIDSEPLPIRSRGGNCRRGEKRGDIRYRRGGSRRKGGRTKHTRS